MAPIIELKPNREIGEDFPKQKIHLSPDAAAVASIGVILAKDLAISDKDEEDLNKLSLALKKTSGQQ